MSLAALELATMKTRQRLSEALLLHAEHGSVITTKVVFAFTKISKTVAKIM